MLARSSDPITSHAAADRAKRFSPGHVQLILAALREHGPSTAHELEKITGLTVVQIDRRLPEAQRDGWARVVKVKGQTLTRGGARVWEAV